MVRITYKKLRALLAHARCAYLYANGDLMIWREEEYKGKRVEFHDVVRGFVPCGVTFRDYVDDRGVSAPDGKGRIVIHDRAFAAIALERPAAASVFFDSMSDATRRAGLAGAGVTLAFAGGLALSLEYTHHTGRPEEPHLATPDVLVQPNSDGPEECASLDAEYTLDAPAEATAAG
jgi:hypothetical protein